MNSTQSLEVVPSRHSPVTPLSVFLCLIVVFFCAVLLYVYAATKHASPVMLDQQGRPLNQSSQQTK